MTSASQPVASDGKREPAYRWRQSPQGCISPAMHGGTDAVASQPDHNQGASPASPGVQRLSASGLTSDQVVAGALMSGTRTGQRHDYGQCRDR